jgi:uncharacterized protein YwqG
VDGRADPAVEVRGLVDELNAMRNLEEIVRGLARPAVRLKLTDRPTRSHFGSNADLQRGIVLPRRISPSVEIARRFKVPQREITLDLVARVSLGELHAAVPIDWLPKRGALLFFADVEDAVAAHVSETSTYFHVQLVDDLEQPVDARASEWTDARPLCRNVEFVGTTTLPSAERPQVSALGLSEAELDAYDELCRRRDGGCPRHRIDGFPAMIQSDAMELECQQDLEGRSSSRFDDAELEAARRDWRLLLQIDSDDDLDVMWGDGGTLYFFVREEDARRGDFSRVRVHAQCS